MNNGCVICYSPLSDAETSTLPGRVIANAASDVEKRSVGERHQPLCAGNAADQTYLLRNSLSWTLAAGAAGLCHDWGTLFRSLTRLAKSRLPFLLRHYQR